MTSFGVSQYQIQSCYMDKNMTRDEIVGANITRLRGKVSMDKVVEEMRSIGNSWSKTTLFNIEHGKRPIRFNEASDLLRCLGYDPILDLPKLLNSPAEADVQFAADQIPKMYNQLIVDFDTLTRYRQDLADDAETLAKQDALNKRLSDQVLEVLKNSRLDDLVGRLIATNDHYAGQVNDSSIYHKWLRSGFDDEDIEPSDLPTYEDVRAIANEAAGNISGDLEY